MTHNKPTSVRWRILSVLVLASFVVNAAGIWGAQVAAMAGVVIPSTPVIHQHIALESVDGHEIPGESPTHSILCNRIPIRVSILLRTRRSRRC